LSAKIKPRLFFVSPFIDKGHGTERCVAEWVSRLSEDFDVHVYSQRVDDIDLSKITWRRIPKLPGPHLLNYIWWFAANHAWRSWDRRFRGIRPDLVFSPGINCLDADVVSVHVVFAEYRRRFADELRLGRASVSLWPQLVHRKLYYRLIAFLENRIYRDPDTVLLLIARRTGSELAHHFGRKPCPVIYLGLDHEIFNPDRRISLRGTARRELGCSDDRFVLLLIGNHWTNKGLPVLLEALGTLRELPIDLLVVGRENSEDYRPMVEEKGLQNRVRFHNPRSDVEFYYAAADVCAGPSLEDTFSLPPAEAMACGLPVIVSSANGTSEIIQHGTDGLILEDPRDATSLSRMIRQLYEDKSFRERLGTNAAQTAREYTWERNARELSGLLEETLRQKAKISARTVEQES
jgi:glycosyltransferase involved in cell wall biosynthesis